MVYDLNIASRDIVSEDVRGRFTGLIYYPTKQKLHTKCRNFYTN